LAEAVLPSLSVTVTLAMSVAATMYVWLTCARRCVTRALPSPKLKLYCVILPPLFGSWEPVAPQQGGPLTIFDRYAHCGSD